MEEEAQWAGEEDGNGLRIPDPSPLVPRSFTTKQDEPFEGPIEGSTNFLPRTELYYPVSVLSQTLGAGNWWNVTCFEARMQCMVDCFDFRALVRSMM